MPTFDKIVGLDYHPGRDYGFREDQVKGKMGGAMVEVFQGDITELQVDAIVNAANNHLWMGGGVAGAIKRRGGQEIEEEAVAKGPIPVGQAVVTGAGRLQARLVIHAATMGQDLTTDEASIREATANSLKRAQELGLGSIAFPALGAGVGGFPLSQAASIILDEVGRHLQGPGSSLRRVVFALLGQEAYRAFGAELASRLRAMGNAGPSPDRLGGP